MAALATADQYAFIQCITPNKRNMLTGREKVRLQLGPLLIMGGSFSSDFGPFSGFEN